jgi:hypothetical protein
VSNTTSGPYDLDAKITDTDTGQSRGTAGRLVAVAAWAACEPGQTETTDELRLHLLSEHGVLGALGLTDDQAHAVHTGHHASGAAVGHPADRVLWNERRIIDLTVQHAGNATLAFQWQATYTRVERGNGGPLWSRPEPAVPEIDQDVYVHAAVGENAASELAVLAIVRERLVAHFAWHPRTAVAAADIVDELAQEIVAENTDDEDIDDEDIDDEDGARDA